MFKLCNFPFTNFSFSWLREYSVQYTVIELPTTAIQVGSPTVTVSRIPEATTFYIFSFRLHACMSACKYASLCTPQNPSPDTSTPSSSLPLPGHKPTYPTALCFSFPTRKLTLWPYTVLSSFPMLTSSTLSTVSIFLQKMLPSLNTYHYLPPPHHCCWQMV